MKKNTDTAMTTATDLLAERRKYEGWLAALHDRRDTTPGHVYTRVLADYEARLQAVVSQLQSKADALDARVQELMTRASALEDDARSVNDQRAEAELRAHVGELEGTAWEKAAQDADARLAVLAQERSAVEAELGSIRELLGAARQPTPAEAGRAVQAGDQPPHAVRGSASTADGGSAGGQQDAFSSSAEAAAGGDAPIVTDATGSPSDVGDAPGTGAAPDASASHGSDASADGSGTDAAATPPAKPTRNTGSFDELAFLRDVTGEGARAAAASPLAPPRPATIPITPPPAAPEAEPELDLEPPTAPERPIKDTLGLVLPDERPALPSRRSSTEIPMAANVTGNAPIILETGGKQNKTLKCTDCGSMNYPTEWYCERCGAELSAL